MTPYAYTYDGEFRGRGRGEIQLAERTDSALLSWYCNKREHKQESCYSRRKAEEAQLDRLARRSRKGETGWRDTADMAYASVNVLAARISGKCVNTDWIIDSGASYHLSQNRHLCIIFKHLSK